jgi:hypothetical protein
MRKIIASEMITVDGYFAGEDGALDWFVQSVIQRASTPHRDAYDWAITLRSNGLLIGWLILGRSRYATEERMHECGCGYALNQH